jgi:ABC-type cobalamin transport system ATPase subunit
MKVLAICPCGSGRTIEMADEDLARTMEHAHLVLVCKRCHEVVFNTATDRWQPEGRHHMPPVMN